MRNQPIKHRANYKLRKKLAVSAQLSRNARVCIREERREGDESKRAIFKQRQEKARGEVEALVSIGQDRRYAACTDQPYAAALGRFFETRERRRRHG